MIKYSNCGPYCEAWIYIRDTPKDQFDEDLMHEDCTTYEEAMIDTGRSHLLK
jgi:hypothetical protein